MKNKSILIPSLLVAISLATAWAIRGKFGHEQGAAWAGGIGALAMILVAKRPDWYNKAFKIALAGAFGWGLGGMISYGVVVGYGRGSDFINVYYGLLMLFVIGAHFGFLGGGLFGLALCDSDERPVKWASLITQMLAFGLLTYAILINQLEWFMTPPRSELWAACFGASIAVAWYVIRLKQWAVLKVAIWSALGAGFGFAFGNVLQVLNYTLKIPMNFWNVMEYSIGFFGGLGMAYATLTTTWPTAVKRQTRYSNLLPIFLLVVFIPFVVWEQSFITDKLKSLLEMGGTFETITFVKVISLALILGMAMFVLGQNISQLESPGSAHTFKSIRNVFIVYLGVFTIISFLVTGIYVHPIEQYLYIVNIVVILYFLPFTKGIFVENNEKPATWVKGFVIILVVLALCAVVMINSHGELKGSQIRFEK